MKLIYVASPYAGDIEKNTAFAKEACRHVMNEGHAFFAPHLLAHGAATSTARCASRVEGRRPSTVCPYLRKSAAPIPLGEHGSSTVQWTVEKGGTGSRPRGAL